MSEFPALSITYWTIFLYFLVALLPVFFAIFSPPRSRIGYVILGSFIMYFASFILTATSESILLATELKNSTDNSFTAEQKAGLLDFRQNIRFLGFLVSFIIGGVGVSVFSKVVASLGSNPEASERILSEIQELRNENSKIKIGLSITFLLILVSIFV